MARMTLDEIMSTPRRVDRAKVDATTEDDIRRHQLEDGEEPGNQADFVPVYPASLVRQQLKMSQEAFANALHIPVATVRNWEQGRTRPDAVGQALLRAVATNPSAVLQAIAGKKVDQVSQEPVADLRPAPSGKQSA